MPKVTKEETTKPLEELENGISEEATQHESQATDQRESEESESKAVKKPTAKAGKRSAKSLKEVEEKQAKEARKSSKNTDEAEKPRAQKPKTRSLLERRGKKYRELYKLIQADTLYSLKDAIELATKTNPAKFDATVEVHINLNVDPKQADQNVRDNLVLPSGTGKAIRVAVFAEADDHAAVTKAGADIVGTDDFLAQLDKEKVDFDILIATPSQMPKLGKYARLLGPKGLMPNPKSGTVTKDVAKAVQEAKAGRVEYRVDSAGIVHVGIGKVSFGTDKLFVNARAVFDSVKNAKPNSIKGSYVKKITLTTSMGPGIKVDTTEL